MARQLIAAELDFLLDERQRTDIFLAVLVPEVVFTADVLGAHVADRLAVIAYDGGSGAGDFGNVLADMTLYVGSTPGAFDRGIARIRPGNNGLWYEPGSGGANGGIRIGETSEIDVQDDDYLTIVNEFAPRPKPLRITGAGVIYMDYEITYTDQHLYPQPVPVMGPHACAWLPAGGTVDVLFDASDSWAPIVPAGGFAFVWACAGAAGIVGGNTATPTITFNAPGTYRVDCQVTADYGGGNTAVFTGHRRVFVFDDDHMPHVKFTLDDCSGDWRSGGWTFRVTMYDGAALYDPATVTGIRDRTLVVLFARDWYGDTETSIGPIQTGGTTIRGNVIASGWIAGESITMNWQQGTVEFTVQGPQHWLAQMTGFPSGLRDTDAPGGPGTPPLDWPDFDDLTVDRGLWHFLHWRSTVTRCMDFHASGDARQTAYFDAPIGTLWEQLQQTAWRTIFAYPCCDRYARLFVEVGSQLLPIAARAGIPVVMALTPADRRGQTDITRETVPPTSQVDSSGVVYADGAAAALFSLAPGHIFKLYGDVRKRPSLALADQAQANTLAGLILSHDNNEFPNVDIPLRGTNRCIDICPNQYVTLSIAPGDTERGIVWTNKELVPRGIRFQMQDGMMLADIETEAYTGEGASTDGDVPPEPPPPPDPPPPPPPPPPPSIPTYHGVIVLSQSQLARSIDFFTAANPAWGDIQGAITGTLYNIVRGANNQLWVTSTDGLWYTPNAAAIVPAWVCIKTDAQAAIDAAMPGHFQSVDLDGDTVIAPWHEDSGYIGVTPPGGYFIGNAGGVNFVSFAPANITISGTLRVGYAVYAPDGIICLGGTVFGPLTGWLHQIGVGNTHFPGEFVMIAARDGFSMAWALNIFAGYAPGAVYDIGEFYGLDVLGGVPLYCGPAQDLYRATIVLANANVVFGLIGFARGRAVYTRDVVDEIAWVTCLPAAGAQTFIVWTDDAFGTFADKTGDFFAAIGNWAGATGVQGADGNAVVITFEH